MTRLLIDACEVVVTMDDAGTEIAGGSILIEDGAIAWVGGGAPPAQADERLDGRGTIAIPGLVNTHHHLYQTLTRSRAQDDGLFDWLVALYPVWGELDAEWARVATRVGLAELALSGCTTTTDHHYVFPRGRDGVLEAKIDAARELGIRFHPTRGSMDLGASQGGLPPDDVCQDLDEILVETEEAVRRFHDPAPGSMLRIAIAPCSPFTVTERLMRESAALARRLGVRLHTHLAETLDEEAYCLERFGRRPIELMDEWGWLGDDVWFAHCVHLDEGDVRRIAETGAGVAWCPTSNLRLGAGIAPARALLDAGGKVGLGVDGSASNDAGDLAAEVRQAMLVSRGVHGAGVALGARGAARGHARRRRMPRARRHRLDRGRQARRPRAVPGRRPRDAGADADPVAALVMCRPDGCGICSSRGGSSSATGPSRPPTRRRSRGRATGPRRRSREGPHDERGRPPHQGPGGVGETVRRVDGVPKVTGAFAYGSDLWHERMLGGATLRSPHPHAAIRSIEPGGALAQPGVHAVLLAEDVPGNTNYGLEFADQPVLAGDVVRYAGQPVAIVAAETPELAARALERIDVDYEVLEPVIDMERALAPDAPKLHEWGNVLRHVRIEHGDPDAEAEVWVEGYYETGMQDQAALGPEAGLAIPAEDGGVDLFVSTQWLHVDRQQIAPCLDLPEDKVRITLAGVGGAFGSREDLHMQIHACMLALHTGRPVKMSYGREESFLAHVHRHPSRIWIRTGRRATASSWPSRPYPDRRGRVRVVLARGDRERDDVPRRARTRCRTRCCEGTAVYTNNPPCGAMRGFGAPQVCFAHEAQMDKLAGGARDRPGRAPAAQRAPDRFGAADRPGAPRERAGARGDRRCRRSRCLPSPSPRDARPDDLPRRRGQRRPRRGAAPRRGVRARVQEHRRTATGSTTSTRRGSRSPEAPTARSSRCTPPASSAARGSRPS